MKKNYFKKASIALSFAALLGSANVNAQVLVGATAGNTGPSSYVTLSQAFGKINDGTHQGVITISITANTTEPASPITLTASGTPAIYTSISIMPSGGNFTINSNAAPSASTGVISLGGADNVTIDGDDPATPGLQNLSIVAAPVTAVGVACIRLASNSSTGLDGANNNTIKNCVIKGSRDAATSNVINYGIQFADVSAATSNTIGAYSSNNTIIQGNTITRCHYGIHAIGNSTVYPNIGTAITSNTIGSATAADYVSFRGIDISYSGTNAVPSTAVISANDIRTGQTAPTSVLSSIEIANANAGITVGRNNIHDGINGAAVTISGMYGIAITSAVENNNILIRNNMIRDMKGGNVTTAGSVNGGIGVMVTASVTGLMIKHNTIAQLATGIVGSCVQINDANAVLSQFLNNALVNSVVNANSTCFYTAGTLNISTGNVNNNDYYRTGATNTGYYNGALRGTLAQWTGAITALQPASTADNSSYAVLPTFVSATDLHIVGGQASLLESTGATTAVTSVTIDIDNQVRPGPVGSIYGGATAPDIGADEFDGLRADCTNPTITVTSSSPSGTVCSAGSVTLTANSTGGGTPTFTFNTMSNGTLSSTAATSIVINPTVATTYTVVGTALGGCSGATTIGIAIDQTATVTAVSSATAVCLNNSVSITASGARTYTLSNGVANGAAFTPTATETYTVSGTNACGTETTGITINVNPLPTLTVSASNPTICSGAPITLTVSGNAASYTWAVTGASTTPVITVTPPAAPTATSGTTTYSVTGTSALGCTATAVYVVTVVTTPVIPALASPSLVCSGSTTTLQTSGANSYTWLPSGQTTSLITVTPNTVTTITALTFTVIKDNAGCTATLTVGIEVHPLPTLFAIVNPTAVCAGTQATLTAGGALNYTWTPIPVGTSTGANIVITPTSSTIYTYTGNNGTCSAVSTISVPVNPIPTLVTTASPTTICNGQPSILTATGAVNYTWTTLSNPAIVLTGSQVSVTPSLTTTYNVKGDNSFGCLGYASQVVFVNPLPNLSVSPASTLICMGRSTTLTAGSIGGPSTYIWDANAGGVTTTTVAVSPTISTVYSFTGTGTNGCPAVKTVSVNVFNQSFAAPTNTAVCFGSTITLNASGANTYTWLPGNAHTASIAVNPTVNATYSVSGTRTVQNNSSVLSCRADYVFSVAVNPNPTVTAVASNTLICRGETSTLTATSVGGATLYTWLPTPTGTGSTVVVGSIDEPYYVNSQTYTVTGTNENNCKHTATVQVITSGCVGIQNNVAAQRELLIFPNPSNGEFTVKSDDAITLTLVNQMGQVIRTITLSDSNDHKETVSDVASGIYFMVGANENGRVSQKVIISK